VLRCGKHVKERLTLVKRDLHIPKERPTNIKRDLYINVHHVFIRGWENMSKKVKRDLHIPKKRPTNVKRDLRMNFDCVFARSWECWDAQKCVENTLTPFKRDLQMSKETYAWTLIVSSPAVGRDEMRKNMLKIDLHPSKETYIHPKRDHQMSKETCVRKKRPIYERWLCVHSRKGGELRWATTCQKETYIRQKRPTKTKTETKICQKRLLTVSLSPKTIM